ncbi:MAG TPA: cbb3-type cytochrome oxidase assembly protein CcoS [Rhodocyclaceae bacterium]|jgi:cbb3-type cytochrome oxidase maturation protein
MEILYLLIPMSVLLVFVIAAIFWWCLRSGQFEDLEGPGYRVLMDDDRTAIVDGVADSQVTPSLLGGVAGVSKGKD